MFPRPVASRDEGKVYRLVAGASGRLLALLMDTLDGEIRLRDAATLTPRGTFLLSAMRTVRGCALSADDAALYAATHDDVRAFALSDGTTRWTRSVPGDEAALATAPDDSAVAVGASPAALVVLRAGDGEVLTSLELPEEPRGIVWDRFGLAALCSRALIAFGPDFRPQYRIEQDGADEEGREISSVTADMLAVAGTAAGRVWIDLRGRTDGALVRTLVIDGDHRAEGLAFSGGVLFIATEGGTYRADPPFEQLVRWLPPLGGAHDPTRIAAVADGHLALAARDIRVFRTRS